MKIFTQQMTVDTDGTTIQRSDDETDGCIPLDIDIKSVSVIAETSTDEFHISGNHSLSDWCKQTGKWTVDGIESNPGRILFYVKSETGSITMNLHVKGH